MRYFVKSHFSGWREVDEIRYNRFIDIIRHGAIAMTDHQKEQYIKTVTYKTEEATAKPPTL